MSHWRYDPPFDWYKPASAASYLEFDKDAFEGYLALLDSEQLLVGFVCLGMEARVPGQKVLEGVVDVGVGIDPSLTSRGIATDAMSIVLDLLCGQQIRTAVWTENDRAISLAKKAGFVAGRELDGPGGRGFLGMIRGHPGSGHAIS